jgi:hypothetical protein
MREDADNNVAARENAADGNPRECHTPSCPVRFTDRGHNNIVHDAAMNS